MRSMLDVRPPGPLRRQPYSGPPQTLRRRAVKASGRAGWAVVTWSATRGYRHRVRLAPLYLAVLLWLVALGLHQVSGGPGLTLLPILLMALCAGFYVLYRKREKRRLPHKHHAYLWGCYAGASGWLVPATIFGPTFGPLSGLLVVGTIAAAVPYWWHRRIRPTVKDDREATPDDDLPIDPEIRTWVTKVQGGDHPILPGAELIEVHRIVDADGIDTGWESPVKFTDHNIGLEDALRQIVLTSRVYDVPVPNISWRPPPDGRPSRAHISVMERNPLVVPRLWSGPSLNEDGVCQGGRHSDAATALYRFWRLGSGSVHSLIAGGTDSGKSRFTDMLLCEEHMSPLITSIVGDPQGGQSLPAWRGVVSEFATSAQECVELLKWCVEVMYKRNKILADLPWIDDKGRERVGVDHFMPSRDMPLMSITIDEAQSVLAFEEGVKASEALAGMARKCGVKLRLITQLPTMPQLGYSMYLRDQIAQGNVVVFRTGGPSAGQAAFNGALPGAEPHTLPKAWPDGSTTAGLGYMLGASSHRAPFRADLVDKTAVHDWVLAGKATPLDTQSRPDPKPEPAAVNAGGVTPISVNLPTKDRILAYVRQAPGPVRTGLLASDLGIALPDASKWLAKLADTKEGNAVIKIGHGEWIANNNAA